MSVIEQWQSGDPCTDCGCDAFMDTPAGRLHAHLADCPRLDVTRLTEQLRGAVSENERLRKTLIEIVTAPDDFNGAALRVIADEALDHDGGQ